MSINQFNRSNLKEVRDIINNALKDALAEHGLTANIGNITFTDEDFNTKLTVSCGTDTDAARREWDKHAYKFGLNSTHFGKPFMHNGKQFTITGIKPKSTKYPILAKNASGKAFKFPPHIVK